MTLPDEPNKGPAAPPVSLSNPNLPVDLFHYTSLNFRARAEGLQHVTLIFDVLEGGRLRSKPVPLTSRWHTHTVHYEDLTYEKQEADRWVLKTPSSNLPFPGSISVWIRPKKAKQRHF